MPSWQLKKARDAVILAHNYQTPEIFHCVADIVGDSLALAREAVTADADVIVLAGVHFMAETAKLLNPSKTRADPRPARRLLAGRIRSPPPMCALLRAALSGRAGRDLRQHLGRGEGRERHLLHLGQCRRRGRDASACAARDHAARRVSGPERRGADRTSRSSPGTAAARCTSASAPRTSRELRDGHPGIIVLAHPECPPEVVAEADFAGSTAAMIDYVAQKSARRRWC